MVKKKTVMVLSAHSDDEALGAGGTIIKLAKENHKIINVIFSYGEKSHPWLKKKYIKEVRKEEAKKADKFLGCSRTIFLDLEEGKYLEDYYQIFEKVKKIIQKEKPFRIYTHAIDDPHPDHKSVNRLTLDIVDSIKKPIEVYAFDVWNPIVIRGRDLPKVYVDITPYFEKKIEAIKMYESQKIAIINLMWSVYARAMVHGFTINNKYAERFYKLR